MKYFVMTRAGRIGGGFHPVGEAPFTPVEAKSIVEAVISHCGEKARNGIAFDIHRGKDGTPENPFTDGISEVCAVPANTRIHYLYRDGSNYKQGHEVIVAGELSWEDIQPHLDEGTHFIASQVGLENIQTMWEEKGFTFPTEDDHVWCEIDEDDIDYTPLDPTVEITAEELKAAFAAVQEWDVMGTMEELGL